jgi:hypothetical protein
MTTDPLNEYAMVSLADGSVFPALVKEIVEDDKRILQVDIAEPNTYEGGCYLLGCRQFYPWSGVVSVTPIDNIMFITMMERFETKSLPKHIRTMFAYNRNDRLPVNLRYNTL